MRPTLLMLAIAFAIVFGSPSTMAREVGESADPPVAAAGAPPPPGAPENRAGPAHKPVSAIGRALAELLQASRAPEKGLQTPAADAGKSSGSGAAPRTELAAQAGTDSTP